MEWLKLRSVRSTSWILLVFAAGMIGLAVLVLSHAHWATMSAATGTPSTRSNESFTGLALGQLVLGVLGVLAITSEFSSGMIRATFAAVPRLADRAGRQGGRGRRHHAGGGGGAGLAAFAAGELALRPGLDATLAQPGVLRAVLMGGAYPCLIALIALGLGAIVRNTAAAISAVVGILFVLPLILLPLGYSIQNSVGQFMPMLIAENSLTAVKAQSHTLSPGLGFGMLCVVRGRRAGRRHPGAGPARRVTGTIGSMESELRRVAGIVLGAPFTRRTRRELLYCLFGGLAGVAGFVVTVVLLTSGFTVSASVIGTVVGLLLITVGLRVSRRLGSLHRRLLRRFPGYPVEAPPRFQPGTGVLGRLDRRLRDRAAWRGVWYSLIKLPVAAVQLYVVTLTIFGLVDITYPVDWLLFRNHSAGTSLSPMVAIVPFPFGGAFHISSWLGTYPAAFFGALCVICAAWLARGITAADHALVRSLLAPTSMAERVSELERTRTLAVEDSAAALRRVERDLHDGAQMRLAALAMNLGMAREKLDDDDATVRELIDAAHRNAVDALADLRDLARGIHPPVLDNGLASALDSLAASSAIPASVTASIGQRPAPAIETIAYFCAAELIANATKHSYANQITINISTERAGLLCLDVSDDGIGGADATRGGLSGLVQRVSTVDGRIDVSSPPGGPTVVTVVLPMKA